MNEQTPFTIEQFYEYIHQGKLMGGKCKKCGKTHLPSRPLCDKCLSKDFQWIEIQPEGRLLTYTIIHVAPPQFQEMTPYPVGIIQLENDLRIPGMIKGVTPEQIKIGMKMKVKFDNSLVQQQWPQWPRYYFKPSKE